MNKKTRTLLLPLGNHPLAMADRLLELWRELHAQARAAYEAMELNVTLREGNDLEPTAFLRLEFDERMRLLGWQCLGPDADPPSDALPHEVAELHALQAGAMRWYVLTTDYSWGRGLVCGLVHLRMRPVVVERASIVADCLLTIAKCIDVVHDDIPFVADLGELTRQALHLAREMKQDPEVDGQVVETLLLAGFKALDHMAQIRQIPQFDILPPLPTLWGWVEEYLDLGVQSVHCFGQQLSTLANVLDGLMRAGDDQELNRHLCQFLCSVFRAVDRARLPRNRWCAQSLTKVLSTVWAARPVACDDAKAVCLHCVRLILTLLPPEDDIHRANFLQAMAVVLTQAPELVEVVQNPAWLGPLQKTLDSCIVANLQSVIGFLLLRPGSADLVFRVPYRSRNAWAASTRTALFFLPNMRDLSTELHVLATPTAEDAAREAAQHDMFVHLQTGWGDSMDMVRGAVRHALTTARLEWQRWSGLRRAWCWAVVARSTPRHVAP